MTPYLLLPAPQKKAVVRTISTYTSDQELASGILSVLEELGDDEGKIRTSLSRIEKKYNIFGLVDGLLPLLDGGRRSVSDWRMIPRRPKKR